MHKQPATAVFVALDQFLIRKYTGADKLNLIMGLLAR